MRMLKFLVTVLLSLLGVVLLGSVIIDIFVMDVIANVLIPLFIFVGGGLAVIPWIGVKIEK